MANYGATMKNTGQLLVVDDCVQLLTSDGTVRPSIYDFCLGSVGSPADASAGFMIARYTTIGASGVATDEVPLDFNSAAAQTTALMGNFGTEPTLLANNGMLAWAMNQRATWRWVASPGGELVGSAAASTSGIGMECTTFSSAFTVHSSVHWSE